MNEIARRAFYNCATITEITIPASIETIGTQVFFKADNLHTVYYNSAYGSSNNPFFSQSSVEKIVFGGTTISISVLDGRLEAIEVVVSGSVTSIGDSVFSGCVGLSSVVIGDSVKGIVRSAFKCCTNLTSVTLGNGVMSIGNYAFKGCTGLTSITFKGTVEQWNAINKKRFWNFDVPATEVICSDGVVPLN